MKISVIIPAFNAEKTIEESINSVFLQDMNELIEIIVINDGSTDLTVNVVNKIIEQNPLSKIIILNQNNQGVATARNNGVNKAIGEYIAFLDSDDVWEKYKLKRQADFLDMHLNFALVAGNFNGLGADFTLLKKIESDNSYYEVTFDNLLLKHYFQPSTVLLRKDIFVKVGGFKSGMTHAEEGLLFFKLAYSHKCALDKNITINYGNGKHAFGDSGLASNLRKMQFGELYNLCCIYRENKISVLRFIFLFFYSCAKFVRRVFIKEIILPFRR
ncbi:glycosyltransferase family 2 protein [Shewanella baltica]|uniref:Glycosyl transferase, family 2 n=1 Tax=Shewanella baltica (strain OS155 / ATCC BAA-1091) TaxID=325240 RepID=A3D6K1_SHEB5|nr:glycosyltransferase family 2 protein [Shewanella baltica]ABN62364.1 glycosyl transferase, family 2 [Shewanella baltica OS155]AEH14708.1 glycosyl transferase family 2 [Shewanella baltica OS117]